MYKAAVIGLGKIGLTYDFEPQRPHPSSHALAYKMSSAFELLCGIDGDSTKMEQIREIVPSINLFCSLEDSIESKLMDDVDVVSICTPPETHLAILLRLIEANIGKVVFCEKPLVSNVKEAEIIRNAIRNKNVIIVPNISRRWNTGLRNVSTVLESGNLGQLNKINIRYTRGIYNTGSHLFDLLAMWTGKRIKMVYAVNETGTSALPEKTFSFCFKLDNGIDGYAEAIDDRNYYQFDVDLFCSDGKIEMRNSGDDLLYYRKSAHHLFVGFQELEVDYKETGLLKDACIKNAIDNIEGVLKGNEEPNCRVEDAIYPLYVAMALEESYINKRYVEVRYE